LWPLAGCAVLFLGGQFSGDYLRYILGLVAVNGMVVLSLDILLGRLGLISIGHAGFVGLGAYASTILMNQGWPFLATVPAAGLLATTGGLLLGIPSLRLSGFYLAIATLAFGAIVEQFIRWAAPLTGGGFGLQVPVPTLFGVALGSRPYFALVTAALVLYVLAAAYLERTVAGRAMLAVKSSEPAAQSIGINVTMTKLLGFALSGFGAGAAGAFYAPLVGFLGPEHFTFLASVSYVAMAVLGGAGVAGSLMGAAVITAVPEVFASLQDYSSLVWGVAMLLILFVSPRGLAYVRQRWSGTS
jgi:branched-chain amino acid transport system permease protein